MNENINDLLKEVRQPNRVAVYKHLLGEFGENKLTPKQKTTLHYIKVQMAMVRIAAAFPEVPESQIPISIIERALLDLHYTDRKRKDYRHYKTALAWRKRLKEGGWLDAHLNRCGFPRHEYMTDA
jgi:hypothetical protein